MQSERRDETATTAPRCVLNKAEILAAVKNGTLGIEEAKALLRRRDQGDADTATEAIAAAHCYTPVYTSAPASATREQGEWLLIAQEAAVAEAFGRQLERPVASCALDIQKAFDPPAQIDSSSAHLLLLKADNPEAVEQLVNALAALAKRWLSQPSMEIVAGVYGEYHQVAAEAFAGFLQVLHIEKPDIRSRVLVMEEDNCSALLAAALAELSIPRAAHETVYYRAGKRCLKTPERFAPAVDATAPRIELRRRGGYLITGGLGGIGLALAACLLREYQAQVVLCGRSDPSGAARARLDALGPRVTYIRADVSDRADVERLIARAQREAGRLHGIFHTAGELADAFVLKMHNRDISRVMAAKFWGTYWLDRETRHLELDFLVLFSSMAMLLPVAGQAAYASANRAMAALGRRRNRRVAGRGATAILHWPLWADGGMRVPAADRAALGIVPMPSPAAFAVLEKALRAGCEELWILYGQDPVRGGLPPQTITSTERETLPAQPAKAVDIETYLIGCLQEVTRLPAAKLHPEQDFGHFGLDSILISQLNRKLAGRFSNLSKTLFFEYKTIRALAAHLATKTQRIEPKPQKTVEQTSLHFAAMAAGKNVSAAPEPIAVVGLAGRYPGAGNLDELLCRLREGDDCITDIPPSRWHLIGYTGPDSEEGSRAVTAGGYIDDVEMFDPFFFGLAPREAELMDPQERLLLQTVWHALEQGGYSVDRLHRCSAVDGSAAADTAPRHNAGVYVGLSAGQFWQLAARTLHSDTVPFMQPNAWSVANRVSYFLDLHGPSIALDTACSSSLTALHLACEALRSGAIRMAIAGGVSLNLDPLRNPALERAHFLSGDRRCHSFGEGGDGFMPGEGVAAMLLKPLSSALADGDVIQCLIKSTAINHGGKSNGYTVPSPAAHASLIGEAISKAGVDPGTITCVEAHGTGTALGDPIEIAGLTRAFTGTDHAHAQHCAIGSIKSNIGHLEPAAALAGLTKLILQLKTGELFPSLHADRENPNIDFSNTPFYLQKKLCTWPCAEGEAYPRRAALSSFGAGGSNGHLIVEEYPDSAGGLQQSDKPQLLLFSAMTDAELKAVAGQYIDYLGSPEKTRPAFNDFGFMLRSARQHLDFRLAFVAQGYTDALEKLKIFKTAPSGRERQAAGLHCGRITDSQAHARKFMPKALLEEVLRTEGWEGIIARWMNNTVFPWHEYETGSLRQVECLPLYPFAKKPLWFQRKTPAGADRTQQDYPYRFVRSQQDSGTRFTFYIPGGSPVVKDHRINGEWILAGTAQLELVRKSAVEFGAMGEGEAFAFRNLVWSSTVNIGGAGVDVHIDLARREKGIAFSLNTDRLHSRGEIVRLAENGAESDSSVPPDDLDRKLPGEELYRLFTGGGFEYGDFYKGITAVEFNRHYCRAQLSLKESAAGALEQLPFHPGLIDAGLHSVAVLQMALREESDRGRGYLPYAVKEIRVHRHARAITQVIARAGDVQDERGRTYHLSFLDETGRLCIEYIDFMCRVVESAAFRPGQEDELYIPAWASVAPGEPQSCRARFTYVMLAPEQDFGLAAVLKAYYASAPVQVVRLDPQLTVADYLHALQSAACEGHRLKIVFLGALSEGPYRVLDNRVCVERLGVTVQALFRLSKALFKLPDRALDLDIVGNDLVRVVDGDPAFNVLANGIVGMAKSLAKELLTAKIRLIDLSKQDLDQCAANASWKPVLEALDRAPELMPQSIVAVRRGTLYRETLQPLSLPAVGNGVEKEVLRKGGTYLILGGAGGLGQATAQYLRDAWQARVVLVGRRPAAEVGLQNYRQADIDDREQMRALIQTLMRDYGEIHGVIHSAIVLEDRSLLQMSEATLQRVLAPKTTGVINLLDAVAGLSLDFIAFFSSATSQVCAAGQANYAAACTLEDALAAYVADRYPRVLILNWGFWREVGVVAQDRYREAFAAKGVAGLSTAEGLRIFRNTLNSDCLQVITGSNASTGTNRENTPLSARVQQVKRHMENYSRSLHLDRLRDAIDNKVNPALTAVTHKLLLSAFQRQGLFLAPGEHWDLERLAETVGLAVSRRALFRAIVQICEQAGVLQSREGGFYTTAAANPVDSRALTAEIDRLRREHPDTGAMLSLLETCVDNLFAVLSGARHYTRVLFPKGSDRLVEPLYRDNPSADLFNRCVAQAAVAFCDTFQNEKQPLTLLEIGAGTGGTTRYILPELERFAPRAQYHYTDISSHFVQRGEQEFGARYSFMQFYPLDIERLKDIGATHLLNGADVVIAANVLHATRDIEKVMQNVRRLLKPGGLLIINEAVSRRAAVTLTFGLTSGWWLFDDGHRRIEHSPLLSPEMWQRTLEVSGFSALEFVGDDPRSSGLGQSVILAWSGATVAEAFRENPAPDAGRGSKAVVQTAGEGSGETANFIRRTLSALQKIPLADIEDEIAFERYGVDSIVALEFLDKIEKRYGSQPADLLLSENTVLKLARYLDGTGGDKGSTANLKVADEVGAWQASIVEEQNKTDNGRVEDEGIAIIGLSGRYPGANNLDAFWENLVNGTSRIGNKPPRRREKNTAGSDWAALLDDVECFDSLFFGIAPREAERMDPQERLMLEVAWEALEDAGYTPERLNRYAAAGSGAGVGVFIGTMYGHYELLAAELWARGRRVPASSAYYALANTISRCLDFRGPSLVLDSACSSSLACQHLAVQSIAGGDCRAALVGGVNLILHPAHQAALDAMKMSAPDGTCRVFSTRAQGFVAGEGVGAAILKPVADARRQGDHIYAIIRATAINANGATAAAVPSRQAQADVIRRCCRKARLDPAAVQYIEAQAMGSALGDKIEIEALADVRRRVPATAGSTWLGTLKPNIGHLEAASGMAQLTKVLLQMKHATLVRTLCEDAPREDIPLAEAGLSIVTNNRPWAAPDDVRRAGISSFGAGGSNAHVLVEQYPVPELPAETAPAWYVLPLSARKPERLKQYALRLLEWLQKNPACRLTDVAFTFQVGRIALRHKLCVVFDCIEVLQAALRIYADKGMETEAAFVGESITQGDAADFQISLPAASKTGAVLLAKAWIHGDRVNWEVLYPAQLPRVQSLPTYPFEPVRHWFTEEDSTPVTESPPECSAVDQSTIDRLVIANVGKVLKIPESEIRIEDALSDFGFDSISLSELIEQFTDHYPIDIDVTLFFEYQTLQAFSRYLYEFHRECFSVAEAPRQQDAGKPTQPPQVVAEADKEAAEENFNHRVQEYHDIAIIGMAGRFPGSNNLDEFWETLSHGRIHIDTLPRQRRERLGLYGESADYSECEKYMRGGFIDDIDKFDPLFFKISPQEANTLDPQQRLILEALWSVIEDAGYDPHELAGSVTGVFVGCAASDYAYLVRQRAGEAQGQSFTGLLNSMLPNRVSFVLGLHGPSEPVDTACSSSLAAVHRAVQSIRQGECEAALAGGVNIILSAAGFAAFGSSGMLAQDGRCKSFDARADGYIRGEGVGGVFLKSVARALADGDGIRAVIRGTAIRHGGHATSITAPNVQAQVRLIEQALRDARIDPGQVGYIETHGTGTQLGDPVEINALKQVFVADARGEVAKTCALGAVKPNIGHLETAAGIAGLIKTVLCLKHRQLPRLATLETPNKLIRLENSPLYLLRESADWAAPVTAGGEALPRCAGVSSFGVGGVIVHLLVQEADPNAVAIAPASAQPYVVVLSARSKPQLHTYARNLLRAIAKPDAPALRDLALTLLFGRHAYSHRLALVADNLQALSDGLEAFLADAQTAAESFDYGHTGATESALGPLDSDTHNAFIEHLLARRELKKIAALWCKGFAVPWETLWPKRAQGKAAYAKVSLPTYPFARQSHWVDLPRPAREKTAAAEDKPAQSGVATHGVETNTAAAIRRQLTRIMSDVLQVPAAQLHAETPLTDFGVDSLTGLRILQRLQKNYGDRIPMAAILENPTIAALADYIKTHAAVSVAPQPEALVEKIILRQGEEKSPLFVICAATGELSWVMHWLPALAEGQRVYGLEIGRTQGALEFTLADFVEQCVCQVEVPGCRIAAYGIAATVALTMAGRLPARGHRVDRLMLFNPRLNPATKPARPVHEVAALYSVLWTDPQRRRHLPSSINRAESEASVQALSTWLSDNGRVPVPDGKLQGWIRRAAACTEHFQSRLTCGETVYPECDMTLYSADPRLLDREETAAHHSLAARAQIVFFEGTACKEEILSREIAGNSQRQRHVRDHKEPDHREPVHTVPVITINKSGVYPRIYCFPTLYGDASYAVPLSVHLGSEFPVYAFEQLDTEANACLYDDFGRMAQAYIPLLLQHRQREPYILLGLSFAGVLVFEIARRLQKMGNSVDALVLIDPYMPNTEAAGAAGDLPKEINGVDANSLSLASTIYKRWKVQKELELDALSSLPPQQQWAAMVEHLYRHSPRSLSREEAHRIFATYRKIDSSNSRAFSRYRARKLIHPVNTLMLSATQGFYNPENHRAEAGAGAPGGEVPVPGDLSKGFKSFVRGDFEIVTIDTDHISLPQSMDTCAVPIARFIKSLRAPADAKTDLTAYTRGAANEF